MGLIPGELVRFRDDHYPILIGQDITEARAVQAATDNPREFLADGAWYRVESVEVGRFFTKVKLQGVNGVFNSTHFAQRAPCDEADITTLKPCPFCGRPAELIEMDRPFPRPYVECPNCGACANGPEDWNKRV